MIECVASESLEMPQPTDPELLARQALCRFLEERAWLTEVARLRAGADRDALIREAIERDDRAAMQALQSYLPRRTPQG